MQTVVLSDDASALRQLGFAHLERVWTDELPRAAFELWDGLAEAREVLWRPVFARPAERCDEPRSAPEAGPLLVAREVGFSQFERLAAWAREGAVPPDGLACVALAGSRFRGQRGRPWTALPGNLHLATHLTLDLDAAATQAGLSLLPSVAVARAIERVSDGRVRPGLKWVNDLLVGGRKVGGVLSATQVQGGRALHLVVGIGVNVARAPELPPSSRALPAGALAGADPVFADEGAWARLLPAVRAELAQARDQLRRGGSTTLLEPYRERAAFLGRHVTIWPVEDEAGPPIARGRVLALNDDLSLELEGVAAPVRRGRMTLDP
jgi:BirA family biotin operon repressor/biotin-[acetyl-CoA-carboxylase] ligase